MLELNATIQPSNTSTIDKHQENAKYTPLQQKLIAIACISFFPLMYLIGSTIVTYF